MYSVYVRIDHQSRILEINSSAFLSDLQGWIKIDEGYGTRFHHAQGNYLSKTLRDNRGILRYLLVNGLPVERDEQDMHNEYLEMFNTPTAQDDTDAMLIDHEYRLTMLELGITE